MVALSVLPHTWAVCRLDPDAEIPSWAHDNLLTAITRTPEELTVVAREECVPPTVKCERDLRCLKVRGPLEFSAVGVLASLAGPLAAAGISIFVMSTFDTDYLFVKESSLAVTIDALSSVGHSVVVPPTTPRT